jgi:hypothetical protein
MISKIFTVLILLLLNFSISAQDTLTFMHYNLLMYGNNFGGCNSSNNNIDNKNEYLHTIVDYVKPDILTVNELDENPYYTSYLLNGALNINGTTYFQMGNPPNVSNAYTVNQIYYNSEKLVLYTQGAISTNYRDIDIFRLYYLSPDLKYTKDTVYLNCCVAHLKASQGYEDERAIQTQKLMNYLNNSSASGNCFMMGDFNVYTNAEPAFQNLVNWPNEEIRFYDPINKMGHWNGSSYYASVHTQSTHTSSGCGAGGGMDDRFDFILVSDEILSGADKAQYVQDSYWAVGQDGQHFDKSLLDYPTNTSVPNDVLHALYNMSDHLPVTLKLAVGNNVGISTFERNNFIVRFSNPVKDNIKLAIENAKSGYYDITIVNTLGVILYSGNMEVSGTTTFTIPSESFKPGLYILRITDKNGSGVVRKIVKG